MPLETRLISLGVSGGLRRRFPYNLMRVKRENPHLSPLLLLLLPATEGASSAVGVAFPFSSSPPSPAPFSMYGLHSELLENRSRNKAGVGRILQLCPPPPPPPAAAAALRNDLRFLFNTFPLSVLDLGLVGSP